MKIQWPALKLITAGLLGAVSLSACQTVPRTFSNPAPLKLFGVPQNRQMHVYYGNLHSHTSYSDGVLTPHEAYKMAMGYGLDFMAVTEHNHRWAGGSDGIFLTPKLYEDLKKTAAEFDQPGKFAALYGQEFSTISSGNHVNVFEASQVIDVPNGDFKTLYEKWLPAHPEVPFIQFNHPDYERDMGMKSDEHLTQFEREDEALHTHVEEGPIPDSAKLFNDYGYDDYKRSFPDLIRASAPYLRTIEILNGPGTSPKPLPRVEARYEKDFFLYLNQGFKLAPTADQDNHYAHWGSLSPARTGVLAPELSKPAIYAALQARRTFATEDKNLQLTMQANGHWMGEEFAAATQPIQFELNFQDADEPQAMYLLQLFADSPGGPVAQPILQEQMPAGSTHFSWSWQAPQEPAGVYVFAKITQTNADGTQDHAWTAPVWLDPAHR